MTFEEPTKFPTPVASLEDDEEWCYECRGRRMCILCGGAGRYELRGRVVVCHDCGGGRWCVVCRGAGVLPRGHLERLIARRALGPIEGFDPRAAERPADPVVDERWKVR